MKLEHMLEMLTDEVGHIGMFGEGNFEFVKHGLNRIVNAIKTGLEKNSGKDLVKYPLFFDELIEELKKAWNDLNLLPEDESEYMLEKIEEVWDLLEADADDNEDCTKMKADIKAAFEAQEIAG